MNYISRPRIVPDSVESRKYQVDMASTCLEKNTLVILPTGLGKTVIGDGYLRWLLRMGDYKNILKIHTGLGNEDEFTEKSLKVAERTQLNIIEAEDGWGTLQPTNDIYAKCKSFLPQ